MNKSSKMVSLFLSTALVLTTAGCSTQQKVVYDKDGKPIVQEDTRNQGFFGGFFGPFGPLGPFGFFGGRSSGSSGISRNPAATDSSTPKSNTGVTGVSPQVRNGSTSTSGGTGITSGSHGGIGGGGASAS